MLVCGGVGGGAGGEKRGRGERIPQELKKQKVSICPPVAGDYSGREEKLRLGVAGLKAPAETAGVIGGRPEAERRASISPPIQRPFARRIMGACVSGGEGRSAEADVIKCGIFRRVGG